MLAMTAPLLPEEAPKHLLGIGEVDDLLAGIGLGLDVFDCAVPTRLARHGGALVPDPARPLPHRPAQGRLGGRPRAAGRGLSLPGLRVHDRDYVSYLSRAEELTAVRLLCLHNLTYMRELARHGARRHSRRPLRRLQARGDARRRPLGRRYSLFRLTRSLSSSTTLSTVLPATSVTCTPVALSVLTITTAATAAAISDQRDRGGHEVDEAREGAPARRGRRLAAGGGSARAGRAPRRRSWPGGAARWRAGSQASRPGSQPSTGGRPALGVGSVTSSPRSPRCSPAASSSALAYRRSGSPSRARGTAAAQRLRHRPRCMRRGQRRSFCWRTASSASVEPS